MDMGAMATLETTSFYNKETKCLPRFRLTYKDKVWEFYEHHKGAASSNARWLLDVLIFGTGGPKWYLGMDEKRIKFKWKEINES